MKFAFLQRRRKQEQGAGFVPLDYGRGKWSERQRAPGHTAAAGNDWPSSAMRREGRRVCGADWGT